MVGPVVCSLKYLLVVSEFNFTFAYKKNKKVLKKSRIWETTNLSIDADSRTDTILENAWLFLRGCWTFLYIYIYVCFRDFLLWGFAWFFSFILEKGCAIFLTTYVWKVMWLKKINKKMGGSDFFFILFFWERKKTNWGGD